MYVFKRTKGQWKGKQQIVVIPGALDSLGLGVIFHMQADHHAEKQRE